MNKILIIILTFVVGGITISNTFTDKEITTNKEPKSTSLYETLYERRLAIEEQLDLLNDPSPPSNPYD